MAITAQMVNDLRARTGAGMMDCKKALVEADGHMEKAIEVLQKKSLASAAKRADKVAAEGQIMAYVHGGRIGVLVEINSETDFVGRSDELSELAKNVAMHIAAANPTYLDGSEIPEALVAKQREIFEAQLAESGKPAAIMGKILDGKIAKWKSEICLVDQAYVKDPDKTVGGYVTEVASRIKENIKIRRFVRFELGEGIERQTTDFAAEVAAQAGV